MQSDQIIVLTRVSPGIAHDSGYPEAERIGETDGAAEFTSLQSARAYVDTARASIGSLAGVELAAALSRMGTAYEEFPELVLECPIEDLLAELPSGPADLNIKILVLAVTYLSAFEPKQSMIAQLLALTEETGGWDTFVSGLRLMLGFREIASPRIEKLLEPLQREGRADRVLQLLSAALGHIRLPDESSRLALDEFLRPLIELPPSQNEPDSLINLATAARRRLDRRAAVSSTNGAAGALVDTAEHLSRLPSPAPLDPRPVLAWPSGRLSFEEFLLQWPCTVELPFDLEDSEFIREVYRAIVLRDPNPEEIQQHLALIREGASKVWIIEDLLSCEELHRLDRQLWVSLGNCVVTEPGRCESENNATVTWPMRVAPTVSTATAASAERGPCPLSTAGLAGL